MPYDSRTGNVCREMDDRLLLIASGFSTVRQIGPGTICLVFKSMFQRAAVSPRIIEFCQNHITSILTARFMRCG